MSSFRRDCCWAFVVALAFSTAGLAEDLGRKDLGRMYPDQGGWCPALEMPIGSREVLRFVADGPVATVTFRGKNYRGQLGDEWSGHRIDNVVVVEEQGFVLEPKPVLCDLGPDFNLCCGKDDDGNFDNLFFDFSATEPSTIVFIDRFAEGPDPRWQGVGPDQPAYWVPASPSFPSAPEPPVQFPGGGSLALGRDDGDLDGIVSASFTLTDLVPGRAYVVTGWWSIEFHDNEVGLMSVEVTSPDSLEPVGETFRINQQIVGDQLRPDVASTPGGEAVVAWEHLDGGCWVIQGHRLLTDGFPLGPELAVSDPSVCDGGPNAERPSVGIAPAADVFAVSWTEDPGLFPGATDRAVLRRFGFADGSPLAGEVTLVDPSSSGASSVGATTTAFDPLGGRFAVSWNESFIGTFSGVEPLSARVYANGGPELSDDFLLAGDGVGTFSWSAGAVAASWVFGEPLLGLPARVFSRRFSAAGAPLGGGIENDATTAPSDLATAANAAGDVFQVWIAADASGSGIFGQLIGASGAPAGPVVQVNQLDLGNQVEPAVASDGVEFLVVWSDGDDIGKIRARRIDAAGIPFDAAVVVDREGKAPQRHPAVAGGPRGRYLVVWEGQLEGLDEQPSVDVLGRSLVVVDDLEPGVAVPDLADAADASFRYFRVAVPLGATALEVTSSGGSGNVDLYLRRGAPPTASDFDRSSTGGGTVESITVSAPEPGLWWVGLRTVGLYEGVDLEAEVLAAGPPTCDSASSALCLQQERFRVEVEWRDFQGRVGEGEVVPFGSDDSGLFWFFDAENWEMLVKVLDGCGVNSHYWLFAAATTNVEYTLRVTDTITGESKSYFNPLGAAAPAITDNKALAVCDARSSAVSGYGAAKESSPSPRPAGLLRYKQGACMGGPESLCLNAERFRVEVEWRDFQGRVGHGEVVPFGSDDSGLFWFFDAENWEMLVKVLDGCGVNGHFWVFAAATTNVEYTLRVTDTMTGEPMSYFNPLGRSAAAITDTTAFETCP